MLTSDSLIEEDDDCMDDDMEEEMLKNANVFMPLSANKSNSHSNSHKHKKHEQNSEAVNLQNSHNNYLTDEQMKSLNLDGEQMPQSDKHMNMQTGNTTISYSNGMRNNSLSAG